VPAFDIITFDCYGTLIDWEGGISAAVIAAAEAAGVTLGRDEILRVHAEVEPEIQAGAYRPYREVLEQVALALAERLGWPLDPDSAGFLPASLPGWPPFPDTIRVLETLSAAGYRLGILSNIDEDLLAGTLEQFTVEFDLLVTAERVRSYKPAPPHFLAARVEIGDAGWLHAAQSYFHDVEPAVALDVPTVWVNRKHESPSGDARPLAAVSDLYALVTWLSRNKS
jgi:2-haloacid dehalogenase/putative hydrolase of the HAD superfamily